MIAVHLFIFLFHNFCTFCHLSLCIHWEQRIDQPPDKLTQECEFSSDFWTRIEDSGYFPGSSDSKESTCNAGDLGFIPGSKKNPVEKEMATHSSILAWRIPWTEEPGRLQSIVLQRIGHDLATEQHRQ